MGWTFRILNVSLLQLLILILVNLSASSSSSSRPNQFQSSVILSGHPKTGKIVLPESDLYSYELVEEEIDADEVEGHKNQKALPRSDLYSYELVEVDKDEEKEAREHPELFSYELVEVKDEDDDTRPPFNRGHGHGRPHQIPPMQFGNPNMHKHHGRPTNREMPPPVMSDQNLRRHPGHHPVPQNPERPVQLSGQTAFAQNQNSHPSQNLHGPPENNQNIQNIRQGYFESQWNGKHISASHEVIDHPRPPHPPHQQFNHRHLPGPDHAESTLVEIRTRPPPGFSFVPDKFNEDMNREEQSKNLDMAGNSKHGDYAVAESQQATVQGNRVEQNLPQNVSAPMPPPSEGEKSLPVPPPVNRRDPTKDRVTNRGNRPRVKSRFPGGGQNENRNRRPQNSGNSESSMPSHKWSGFQEEQMELGAGDKVNVTTPVSATKPNRNRDQRVNSAQIQQHIRQHSANYMDASRGNKEKQKIEMESTASPKKVEDTTKQAVLIIQGVSKMRVQAPQVPKIKKIPSLNERARLRAANRDKNRNAAKPKEPEVKENLPEERLPLLGQVNEQTLVPSSTPHTPPMSGKPDQGGVMLQVLPPFMPSQLNVQDRGPPSELNEGKKRKIGFRRRPPENVSTRPQFGMPESSGMTPGQMQFSPTPTMMTMSEKPQMLMEQEENSSEESNSQEEMKEQMRQAMGQQIQMQQPHTPGPIIMATPQNERGQQQQIHVIHSFGFAEPSPTPIQNTPPTPSPAQRPSTSATNRPEQIPMMRTPTPQPTQMDNRQKQPEMTMMPGSGRPFDGHVGNNRENVDSRVHNGNLQSQHQETRPPHGNVPQNSIGDPPPNILSNSDRQRKENIEAKLKFGYIENIQNRPFENNMEMQGNLNDEASEESSEEEDDPENKPQMTLPHLTTLPHPAPTPHLTPPFQNVNSQPSGHMIVNPSLKTPDSIMDSHNKFQGQPQSVQPPHPHLPSLELPSSPRRGQEANQNSPTTISPFSQRETEQNNQQTFHQQILNEFPQRQPGSFPGVQMQGEPIRSEPVRHTQPPQFQNPSVGSPDTEIPSEESSEELVPENPRPHHPFMTTTHPHVHQTTPSSIQFTSSPSPVEIRTKEHQLENLNVQSQFPHAVNRVEEERRRIQLENSNVPLPHPSGGQRNFTETPLFGLMKAKIQEYQPQSNQFGDGFPNGQPPRSGEDIGQITTPYRQTEERIPVRPTFHGQQQQEGVESGENSSEEFPGGSMEEEMFLNPAFGISQQFGPGSQMQEMIPRPHNMEEDRGQMNMMQTFGFEREPGQEMQHSGNKVTTSLHQEQQLKQQQQLQQQQQRQFQLDQEEQLKRQQEQQLRQQQEEELKKQQQFEKEQQLKRQQEQQLKQQQFEIEQQLKQQREQQLKKQQQLEKEQQLKQQREQELKQQQFEKEQQQLKQQREQELKKQQLEEEQQLKRQQEEQLKQQQFEIEQQLKQQREKELKKQQEYEREQQLKLQREQELKQQQFEQEQQLKRQQEEQLKQQQFEIEQKLKQQREQELKKQQQLRQQQEQELKRQQQFEKEQQLKRQQEQQLKQQQEQELKKQQQLKQQQEQELKKQQQLRQQQEQELKQQQQFEKEQQLKQQQEEQLRQRQQEQQQVVPVIHANRQEEEEPSSEYPGNRVIPFRPTPETMQTSPSFRIPEPDSTLGGQKYHTNNDLRQPSPSIGRPTNTPLIHTTPLYNPSLPPPQSSLNPKFTSEVGIQKVDTHKPEPARNSVQNFDKERPPFQNQPPTPTPQPSVNIQIRGESTPAFKWSEEKTLNWTTPRTNTDFTRNTARLNPSPTETPTVHVSTVNPQRVPSPHPSQGVSVRPHNLHENMHSDGRDEYKSWTPRYGNPEANNQFRSTERPRPEENPGHQFGFTSTPSYDDPRRNPPQGQIVQHPHENDEPRPQWTSPPDEQRNDRRQPPILDTPRENEQQNFARFGNEMKGERLPSAPNSHQTNPTPVVLAEKMMEGRWTPDGHGPAHIQIAGMSTISPPPSRPERTTESPFQLKPIEIQNWASMGDSNGNPHPQRPQSTRFADNIQLHEQMPSRNNSSEESSEDSPEDSPNPFRIPNGIPQQFGPVEIMEEKRFYDERQQINRPFVNQLPPISSPVNDPVQHNQRPSQEHPSTQQQQWQGQETPRDKIPTQHINDDSRSTNRNQERPNIQPTLNSEQQIMQAMLSTSDYNNFHSRPPTRNEESEWKTKSPLNFTRVQDHNSPPKAGTFESAQDQTWRQAQEESNQNFPQSQFGPSGRPFIEQAPELMRPHPQQEQENSPEDSPEEEINPRDRHVPSELNRSRPQNQLSQQENRFSNQFGPQDVMPQDPRDPHFSPDNTKQSTHDRHHPGDSRPDKIESIPPHQLREQELEDRPSFGHHQNNVQPPGPVPEKMEPLELIRGPEKPFRNSELRKQQQRPSHPIPNLERGFSEEMIDFMRNNPIFSHPFKNVTPTQPWTPLEEKIQAIPSFITPEEMMKDIYPHSPVHQIPVQQNPSKDDQTDTSDNSEEDKIQWSRPEPANLEVPQPESPPQQQQPIITYTEPPPSNVTVPLVYLNQHGQVLTQLGHPGQTIVHPHQGQSIGQNIPILLQQNGVPPNLQQIPFGLVNPNLQGIPGVPPLQVWPSGPPPGLHQFGPTQFVSLLNTRENPNQFEQQQPQDILGSFSSPREKLANVPQNINGPSPSGPEVRPVERIQIKGPSIRPHGERFEPRPPLNMGQFVTSSPPIQMMSGGPTQLSLGPTQMTLFEQRKGQPEIPSSNKKGGKDRDQNEPEVRKSNSKKQNLQVGPAFSPVQVKYSVESERRPSKSKSKGPPRSSGQNEKKGNSKPRGQPPGHKNDRGPPPPRMKPDTRPPPPRPPPAGHSGQMPGGIQHRTLSVPHNVTSPGQRNPHSNLPPNHSPIQVKQQQQQRQRIDHPNRPAPLNKPPTLKVNARMKPHPPTAGYPKAKVRSRPPTPTPKVTQQRIIKRLKSQKPPMSTEPSARTRVSHKSNQGHPPGGPFQNQPRDPRKPPQQQQRHPPPAVKERNSRPGPPPNMNQFPYNPQGQPQFIQGPPRRDVQPKQRGRPRLPSAFKADTLTTTQNTLNSTLTTLDNPPASLESSVVPIALEVSIENLEMNEVNMELNLEFYLRQSWTNPGLKFQDLDFQFNQSHEIARLEDFSPQKTCRPHKIEVNSKGLDSSGQSYKVSHISMTMTCPMTYKSFPLDSQIFRVDLQNFELQHSLFDDSDKELQFHWKSFRFIPEGEEKAAHLESKFSKLYPFKVAAYRLRNDTQKNTEPIFSKKDIIYGAPRAFEILFERPLKSVYQLRIYLAPALVTLLSLSTLFFGKENGGLRLSVNCGGMLGIIGVAVWNLGLNLPASAYDSIKMADIFVAACGGVILICLVLSIALYFLEKKRRQLILVELNKLKTMSVTDAGRYSRQKIGDAQGAMSTGSQKRMSQCESGLKWIDLISKICIPTAFLIFNIAYWLYALDVIGHMTGEKVKESEEGWSMLN